MNTALENDFLEKIHLKKIQEITKYVGIFLLAVMIVFCVYTKLMTVVFVISIIVVLFLCFQNAEDIICMKIILLPFHTLLSNNFYTSYFVLNISICLILFVKYVFDIINKKKRISYLVWGILIVYLVYCGLPIFNKRIGVDLISSFINTIIIAIAYEYREDLHLKNFTLCFSVSILLSCVLSIFLKYVSDWRIFLDYHGDFNRNIIPKFKAFEIHSNIFAGFSCFSISLLCFLRYKKQIDDLLFYLLFVPTFIFGYLTVSRAYIVVLSVILLTYFILLIIRDKKESLKIILPIISIIIIIALVLYKITGFYFNRFLDNYEFNPNDGSLYDGKNYTEEDWALVYAGEKIYNTGRVGLYKTYLKFFLNNPIVFIFGRGSGFPSIGKTHSHNFIIDLIYKNGVVGILIYLVMLFFMFDLKNIKKYWNMDRLSIVIILFGWFMYELLNTYFSFLWLLCFIVAFYDKSLYKTNQDIENIDSEKINKGDKR